MDEKKYYYIVGCSVYRDESELREAFFDGNVCDGDIIQKVLVEEELKFSMVPKFEKVSKDA